LGIKGKRIVAGVFGLNSTRVTIAVAALAAAAATSAIAQQQAGQPGAPSAPSTTQAIPSVVKATAIVNGDIVTQTDIDQRVALLAIANGGQIPTEEVERLRQQVLRNLIDETLQIQAAKQEEIQIKPSEIDRTVARVASNLKMTPEQATDYLQSRGSSIRALRRQIEGEIAWQRLQRAKIESGVVVGDEEVKAVLDKLNASKGTEEYRVGEIFLSASPATESQTIANANKILEQLRSGASFAGYARQYSEASTAAVGGDLGWVRPEQLPSPLAAVVREMRPGTLSAPIPVPGGVSILTVQDTRKILTRDPRDAVLSLKQVSINFPKGTSRAVAEPMVARFAQAARNVGGCGGAEKIAAEFKAEIVQQDGVKMRDLPAALQQMMLQIQVGQATPPFGSLDEGVRTLVVCGRDEVDPTAPSYDEVYSQLNEERVNSRSRRYLRDLRRDAIIEFR
jgi:peptidyl-prolyl cis-trans isomerase SurA